METLVEVSLWGHKIGVLAWNPSDRQGVFEFYNTFPKLGWDIAPLTMPLRSILNGDRIYSFPENGGKTFKGLPGLLADALPDDYGNTIIDEYFASKGYSSIDITPVDRLCYLGVRAMGALEFHPASHDLLLNTSSVLELEHLTALAGEILNNREKFQKNLKNNNQSVLDILKIGTSAGGVKPKAIIAWNEQTNEVRSGQVQAPDSFTYWLLKFDGIEDQRLKDNPLGIGRIEYAYHRMALDCGVVMTECRLLQDRQYSHFMTKRFDRSDKGFNKGTKIHTQTLCSIAHYDRDKRYSYEQAFQVMRRLHFPATAMEQFYRRMVFNVVARNHDDHTKNHAFIMNETGAWELAPAYDLLYSYNSSGRWTNQHQMSVNNKRDKITRDDLLSVAHDIGIRSAKEVIDQTLEVVSNWKVYACEADVKKEHIQEIGRNFPHTTPNRHNIV